MKPLFDEIDTDKDGCLSESELKTLFEKYGCSVSRATMHNMVRLVDDKNTGAVHWDEFTKIFDIIEEVRSNSHFGKEKPKAPETPSKQGEQNQGALSPAKELPKQGDAIKDHADMVTSKAPETPLKQ